MQIIILAAGEGKRLRPLTNEKPKCLVELNGTPLLEHQLKVLNSLDVRDIHVVGGYQAHKLEKYKINLHINKNYKETNMVHTLFTAWSHVKTGLDLVISYGDIVYEKSVLLALKESDAPVSVVIDQNWLPYWKARMDNPLKDAETLKLNDAGQIMEIGRQPNSYEDIQGQYTGLIKIRSDHVKKFGDYWMSMDREKIYDGQNFQNMYMTSFIQAIINDQWDVRAVQIENGWAEIDNEDDLKVATQFWKPHD